MLNCEEKFQLEVTQGLISKSEVTGAVTTISTHIQRSANDFCQRRPTVRKTIKCFQHLRAFGTFRDLMSVFPPSQNHNCLSQKTIVYVRARQKHKKQDPAPRRVISALKYSNINLFVHLNHSLTSLNQSHTCKFYTSSSLYNSLH